LTTGAFVPIPIDLWRKRPPEIKFRRVFDVYELGKMLTFGAMNEQSRERTEPRT